MTVQNAFLIFLLSFSGITAWLMLREPAKITVADHRASASEKKEKTDRASSTPTSSPEASSEAPDRTQLVRNKLSKVIIPVVDFREVSIEEAIDFLRVRARELDPDVAAPSSGISFVIRHPRIDSGSMDEELSEQLNTEATASTVGNKTINLYAEEVSLTEALDLICEKVDCRWEITDHHVVILPLD
ncbi:hypothetical protein [Oceaniferula spumae]